MTLQSKSSDNVMSHPSPTLRGTGTKFDGPLEICARDQLPPRGVRGRWVGEGVPIKVMDILVGHLNKYVKMSLAY